MARTYKEVAEYVEWQNHGAGKVLSVKPEHRCHTEFHPSSEKASV